MYVGVQDYCKSDELISLKLGAFIGPNNRMNRLTFGDCRDSLFAKSFTTMRFIILCFVFIAIIALNSRADVPY